MTVSGLHIWFAAMLGIAVVMVLIALVRREAFWALAGMFIAGSAAQLGLTDPLWFGSLLLKPQGFALICYALIGAQALSASVVLLRRDRISALFRGASRLGIIRITVLALLLLASTVSPMGFLLRHEYAAFAKQVIAATGLVAITAATLAAMTMLLPERSASRLSVWINRIMSPHPRFPWLAALWVFTLCTILAMTAFDRMPRLPDEVAYLFQARTLAGGALFAPAPGGVVDVALRYDWITMVDGKWFSIFPPGWPAILALGVAAGLPFLVNPLLAAAAILLSYALVARIASRRLAVLTTLTLAISPWYLAMGASLMSHTLTLVLVLGAWLLISNGGRARSLAFFSAGCLMGWLFLTRPLEGLAIGVLTGLWVMRRVKLRSLSGWVAMSAYGVGCFVIGALIFPYNQLLTNSALTTPIDQYFNTLWHMGANRLGFGADIGSPNNWGGIDIWRGHSPLEALIDGQFNLTSLNVELLGWASGSLLFLYVHLIWGRLSRTDWFMLAVIALTICAYGFYWFNGGFYIGPRYWFMTLWPALFLSARGLQTAVGVLRVVDARRAREQVATIALAMGAVAVIAFLPWRATTKYWEFRGFHSGYRDMVSSGALDNALIFVKNGDSGEFGSAFMLNAPDLHGPIFLRDLGPAANAEIIARYPGRQVRYIPGRQIDTNGGNQLQ